MYFCSRSLTTFLVCPLPPLPPPPPSSTPVVICPAAVSGHLLLFFPPYPAVLVLDSMRRSVRDLDRREVPGEVEHLLQLARLAPETSVGTCAHMN